MKYEVELTVQRVEQVKTNGSGRGRRLNIGEPYVESFITYDEVLINNLINRVKFFTDVFTQFSFQKISSLITSNYKLNIETFDKIIGVKITKHEV